VAGVVLLALFLVGGNPQGGLYLIELPLGICAVPVCAFLVICRSSGSDKTLWVLFAVGSVCALIIVFGILLVGYFVGRVRQSLVCRSCRQLNVGFADGAGAGRHPWLCGRELHRSLGHRPARYGRK
jgi:hypothetical protein